MVTILDKTVKESLPFRYSLRGILLSIAIAAVAFSVLRLLPRYAIQVFVVSLPAMLLVGVWALYRQQSRLFLLGMIGGYVGIFLTPHLNGGWRLGQEWSGLLLFEGRLLFVCGWFGAIIFMAAAEIIWFVGRR